MSKNNLFKLMFVALFAFAAVAFTGCKDDIEDVKAPELSIDPMILNFDQLGGTQTVQLKATCDWEISTTLGNWIDIQPMSGSGDTTLTVTTYENTQGERVVVYFTLYHPEYGAWGKSKNTLTVTQTATGEDVVEEIYYYNDFDKEAAEKTYGSSGTSWPYLDQFEGWKNESGTGAENVEYAFTGMSARNNSNSNGSYSDYDGSGVNNMFFGANAYLTIGNIAVASTNVHLSFGGEKYLNGADSNAFVNDEFAITLSADGTNWSAPIEYTAPEGDGRWNLGEADFTLPEGTTTLYIKFAASVASAYRMDDVKLEAGLGGQAITFDGTENPGTDPKPTPTPTPGGAIYYNNFDLAAAEKTYGSGSSWPYLDQFDGWMNQTGSGAENVTYDYKGASARNNSNSNGEYSDYEGSGVNNIFFGSNAYLTIENIALETNKLNLTFGGEKYLQGADNTFSTSEFTITLSADGTNWSEPIEYTAPAGQGRWNVGSADFTIPEGTSKLYIKFAASVASAYRIDDVMLSAGEGGQEVALEGGETPGPGDEPAPTPTDAVYENNFDKEAAEKTYGSSGTSWPYLDQFEGWKNESGTGAENVTYDFNGMSARNNSNSDGEYSDYAGSGVNNMFFGKEAYLTIGNIALETNKLNLTFGGEKYLQGSDNTFSTSEFTITLSADGTNWSEPIEYTAPAGQGRWNVGSADFTLPEGTSKLYIKFAASAASAYRIDDVKLVVGNGGQEVALEGGETPGPGDEPTPTPTPDGAFYTNNFDKAAAEKTYGSGSSWPYLDQFDGWKNESGSGAANITYDFSGMSARNNSNSDGDYSDYAGSGVNNMFFGKEAYFTIGNIAITSENVNLTFGGEKYLQGSDNTFSTSEFTITLSADGTNWSAPITYTAPAGAGRWNVGSADFTLPAGTSTLYVKFAASVASAYRIDDVTIAAGNGGQQIAFNGGSVTPEDPEPTPTPTPGEIEKISILEFLNKPVDATVYYELTGEITSIRKADYGNIDIKDETGSVYIYGLTATKVTSNDKSFASLGLKVGDVVTLHTPRGEYNGEAQGGGTTTPAYYISHVANTTTPEGGGFTKVTSVSDLTDGEYLIVYDANSPAYVFNGADMVNGYEEATVSGNSISGSFTCVVTIEAMEGGYSLQAPAGYMSGTADANKLNFGSTAALNTIIFEADGTALITSNTSVLRFNSASNQMRFRYYKTASYANQQPVSLYKKN